MDSGSEAAVLSGDNSPKYVTARKVIRTVDRTIDRILTVLLLIVLLIGVWLAYDSYYVFNGARVGSMQSFKPEGSGDAGLLKKLGPDVVAWLTVDETSIDYPVVQGIDNNEYLNKNAYGEYSLSGAIFLDSFNKEDFSDAYNLVYGHHMSGGYMFGALDDFEQKGFFDTHRTGKLVVSEGKTYRLEIFAFMHTDASKDEVFDVTVPADRLAFIRENSLHFVEPGTEHILALSTCKSPLTTDRTIVFAALMEITE